MSDDMYPYFPYMRGKQYELLAIRESAKQISDNGFVPIIEPVRKQSAGLVKAINEVCQAGGRVVVVVNPIYGDFKDEFESMIDLYKQISSNSSEGSNPSKGIVDAGILLTERMTQEQAINIISIFDPKSTVWIHSGFTNMNELSDDFLKDHAPRTHIFLENHANLLYRRRFKDKGGSNVLIRDGFISRKNADYPERDHFSDLHVVYQDLGMDGFGDFQIIGDNYSESGGPAYAVAIHLTYVDPDLQDDMFVLHFKSDDNDTPTDPAGKFSQAVGKLVKQVSSRQSKLLESDAIKEFRRLHDQGRYPGLGYVKKLSIKHHFETMATFLGKQ